MNEAKPDCLARHVSVMSALGHKRTFAVQKRMSALPPKADMCSALVHVRFVPKADIAVTRDMPKIFQDLSFGRYS